jgi:hypothetical protein
MLARSPETKSVRRNTFCVLASLVILFFTSSAQGQNSNGTRLLRMPTVSDNADRICLRAEYLGGA